MLYEIYKSLEAESKDKQEKTEADNTSLIDYKAQIYAIEQLAHNKMQTDLNWTAEEILLRYGHHSTISMEFHPSSDGYRMFGKSVVGNVSFSKTALTTLLLNIQNNTERTAGLITFKRIPELTIHEVSTGDIFQIRGQMIS